MKIAPASAAGQKLMSFGVTAQELDAASFLRLDWQFGSAVTLALPGGKCLVLIKGKYLEKDETGGLRLTPALGYFRHELCHVGQALRWGFFGYWRRHLWARLKTRSILAKESDAERPCYEAGAAARDALSPPS